MYHAIFSFNSRKKYDQLPRASEYIKAASFDASKQQVTMDTAAYGYKAHFIVEVHPVHDVEPWRLDYKIVSGPFEGMTGAVTFAELGPKKMEIGLTGEAHYSELPVPRFFLTFGLEVILQKLAARLRGFAADEYGKSPVASHWNSVEESAPCKSLNSPMRGAWPFLTRMPWVSSTTPTTSDLWRRRGSPGCAGNGLSGTHYPKSDKILAVVALSGVALENGDLRRLLKCALASASSGLESAFSIRDLQRGRGL